MLFKKIALAGAAAAALLVSNAAFAYTHHPSTPAERQATDDLNAKALADARSGTAGTQPTAATNPQPAAPTPSGDQNNMTTPSPDMTAPAPGPTDAAPAPTSPTPNTTNDGTTPAPAPTQPAGQ